MLSILPLAGLDPDFRRDDVLIGILRKVNDQGKNGGGAMPHPLIAVDVICRAAPAAKEAELAMALADAPKFARFSIEGLSAPVELRVAVANNALMLCAQGACGNLAEKSVSLTPLRRIIKDYRLICENYNQAIAVSDSRRVETIDVGRRAFHNDGAEWLQEKIAPSFAGDDESYRYLFTLVNILYL